tara:strand:+ start:330 stop:548 length:219 start_codon:yes stop_codon:yes gene_type:complete
MVEKNNIINIDGKDYTKDDFNQSQLIIVNRLSKLQADAHQLRIALDENAFLQEGYVNKLKESLQNTKEDKAS